MRGRGATAGLAGRGASLEPTPEQVAPRVAPGIFDGLFGPAAKPAPDASPRGSRLRRRGMRIIRRTARQLTKTVGSLYMDLGEALMHEGRFEEAIDAYRRALDERSSEAAWRSEVYASLAGSAIQIASQDDAVRSKALRVGLEAALMATETLEKTARRVLQLADPAFLEEHGGWVAQTWLHDTRERDLDPIEKTLCDLLAVRCALYTGAYAEALELLYDLRRANPAPLAAAGPRSLREPLIPAAVASVASAPTYWVLAQALEAAGDDKRALEHAEAALAAGFEQPGETELAVRWCEELADQRHRPALDTAMRALIDDPHLANQQRETIASMRFRRSRRRRDERPRLRPVAPVSLCLSPHLIPEGSQSNLLRRLTENECPAIRDQLQMRAGIRLPGIQLLPDAASGNDSDYTILVRGVPVKTGRMPETRQRPSDPAEIARVLGSELQRSLRPRLAEFVGISEVGLELADWVARGSPLERQALLERALAGLTRRADFSRLVHRLVEQQVPVDQFSPLLSAYAEASDRRLDPMATVEHARRALARHLDPDAFERDLIELDPEAEAALIGHVRHDDPSFVLALPEEEAATILAGLEHQLAGRDPSTVAVVVQRARLRPCVQQLVDSRWRGMAAVSLSEIELLTPRRRELEPTTSSGR